MTSKKTSAFHFERHFFLLTAHQVRIITVFSESSHSNHDKKESQRENFISYHMKCKVTSHPNSQEKFGINEKKIIG